MMRYVVYVLAARYATLRHAAGPTFFMFFFPSTLVGVASVVCPVSSVVVAAGGGGAADEAAAAVGRVPAGARAAGLAALHALPRAARGRPAPRAVRRPHPRRARVDRLVPGRAEQSDTW